MARSHPRRIRARTQRLVQVIAAVMAVSLVAGAGFGLAYDPTAAGVARSMTMGAVNGAVLTSLEIGLRAPAGVLRPVPVAILFLARMLIYAAVFVASTLLAAVLVRVAAPAIPMPSMMVMSTRALVLSFVVGLIINFVLVLRTQLGPRALVALITGRYQQPREERRIVMFLDLAGSTQLAERLGDLRFHRFLNRVFFDITDAVLESDGEIYRYVGDEIIVTWLADRGEAARAAIGCLFAIIAALKRREADYRKEFDAAPRLRGALHAGSLIAGEMGDTKREIVMLGDTMNTTARIEEICRRTGRDHIASAAVVRAARTLPEGINVDSLGSFALRGKEAETELFALSGALSGERSGLLRDRENADTHG
jgi:adenylate cyclase